MRLPGSMPEIADTTILGQFKMSGGSKLGDRRVAAEWEREET